MNLRRNIIWTWLGQSVYLGCQLAILMVLAKLSTTVVVGQFSLALAITAPIVILSQMQFRQSLVTDTQNRHSYSDYFWCRVFLTIAALAVIICITFLYRFSSEMRLAILLTGLAKAFESLSDITHGSIQRHDRMDFIGISVIAKGILSLVLFSGLFWVSRSLIQALVGLVISWAALFFIFDLPVSHWISKDNRILFSFKFSAMRDIFFLTLPLGLTIGLVSLSGNLPRYFLGKYWGKEAVAIFSVAAAPLNFIVIFSYSIYQAAMAKSAKYFQEKRLRDFEILAAKVTGLIVFISIVFTVLFVIFGEKFIYLFFTKDYKASALPLVILSFSMIIGNSATFFLMILVAGRKFALQLLHITIVAVTQILLCYCLVPRFGVMGAAWSEFIRNILSFSVFAVFGFLILKKQAVNPVS